MCIAISHHYSLFLRTPGYTTYPAGEASPSLYASANSRNGSSVSPNEHTFPIRRISELARGDMQLLK
ncbi:hypothetical protein RvY_17236 [Ramazzottius varieornatus]|uniref:Uncharacterized protein n=1 Tax=Ramazzottius varieornatus TaxID=947166 RepID=A0A1D1W5E9_RAMVA|nr:hypothetical protein RvY_17236 [Ramazzottius varieornatus]